MNLKKEDVNRMLRSDTWELVRDGDYGYFRQREKHYMKTVLFKLSEFPQAKQRFVMVDAHGDYVGIDQASGGYPHITGEPFSAKFWNDIEEAKKYRKTMKAGFAWSIHEFKGFKLGASL